MLGKAAYASFQLSSGARLVDQDQEHEHEQGLRLPAATTYPTISAQSPEPALADKVRADA